MNTGSSNRLLYDRCSYQQWLTESTSPLDYRLYHGAHENCNKCAHTTFYAPYDLVDVETELQRRNRPLSDCNMMKYNPNCKKSGMCLSTFDKSVPIVPAPEVCPIIYNNIPKVTKTGIRIPNPNFC